MYIVFIILLLNSCALGYIGVNKTKTGSNWDYRLSGHGYNDRLYTQQNIDLLAKSVTMQEFSHSIVKRKDAEEMKRLIAESGKINNEKTKFYIEEYIKNYSEMLQDDEQAPEQNSALASKDYFNIEEYGKERPLLNIITVKYLATNQIMPMTDDVSDIFKDYYSRNITDMKHNSVDQFNPELDDSENANDIYDMNKVKPIDKKNIKSELKNNVLHRKKKHKEYSQKMDFLY